MAKIKKTKEKNKSENSIVKKVSKKTSLKPKVIEKTKKPLKKIKIDDQIVRKVTFKKEKSAIPFSTEQFQKGIDALLQYVEKSDTKDLFTTEKPIFVQIEAVKIPHCPNRRIRLPLKHTLLTEKQEVCLIVPDLKKGRQIDHEPTIEHYEELLRTQKVQSIKRIIPIRQLRVEYDQFELKRRLCGYYDYFLVAGNIAGHVLHLLGKVFIEKRKTPIPIKIDAPNLNETIENALKKVTMSLHSHGMSFIVQFGHSEMSQAQLAENLNSVCQSLNQNFPGGFTNIRSLHIKTDKSIAIPVYYSLKSSNKVPVPVIKPIRPKKFEKVTDELTTKSFGKSEVTVHPGGKIEYEKKQNGLSKNQKRKIIQGKIQKRSMKIRAKQEKLRKLKKPKKNEEVRDITVTIKNEKKKKNKDKNKTETVTQENGKKSNKVKNTNSTPEVQVKKNKKKKNKSKPVNNLENGVEKTKKKNKKAKKSKQTTVAA